MRIVGIDSVVYGVEDMAESIRFCTDFGFLPTTTGPDGALFECLDGSTVVVRPIDDPALPPTTRTGSTLRELVLGVQDQATLDQIAQELAHDRAVRVEGGRVHSVDDEGQALAFQIVRKRVLHDPLPAANVPGHAQRPVNSRADFDRRVQPRGIAHVVFNCADEARARAFYVDRLGYKVSDSLRGTPGAFLRTSIAREHHSLFTAQSDRAGLNHVAFYMTDFHEVMLGGKFMTESGWPTRWGPGRHRLGSNYFWYLTCPLGGAMEYTSDVDIVDEHWVPSEVDATFANAAIWSTQFVHKA